MAKSLMVLGTASSVGKTVLTAGLCRVFKRKGLKVIPFKSQNMSRFPYISAQGLQFSYAQAMQAEAAGIEPRAEMNPIWLKPKTDCGSELWVNGECLGRFPAKEYYKMKKDLWPQVQKAYEKIEKEADLILVEGAGSPAELNLQADDFVNLGLAERLRIPAILVGDINRGGIFASLYGTIALATEEQKKLYKGLIVNQFRGDISLFDSGVQILEEICQRPVLGVVPMTHFELPEEDSLSLSDKTRAEGNASSGDSDQESETTQAMSREDRERAYDLLADHLEQHLDLAKLEEIIQAGV